MKAIDLTNRRVVIRTASAGVHFGTLVHKEGMEVHLKTARRLWSWNGALSLHEVAKNGIDLKNSKVSEVLDDVVLTQAIEILPIMKASNLPC